MRLAQMRRSAVAAVLAVAAMGAVTAGCGDDDESAGTTSSTQARAATLQLWAGGLLSSATPGSSARDWLDEQIDRFKESHPGSDVKVTLLPTDLNALSAKVQSAFASGEVPDVMTLWSGNLTIPYADGLMRLNEYVDAQHLYESFSGWELSCVDYDCRDGAGEIVGVPIEAGGYFLFYNKDLLREAGISEPPETYEQLYAACKTLRDHDIQPMSWGNKGGYQVSNAFTPNLVSTLEEGDVGRLLSGEMAYTDPKLVDALDAVLRTGPEQEGCMDASSITTEQLTGAKDFLAGKAAMTTLYGVLLGDMKRALGDKLGVARLPVSGDGPLLDVGSGYAANSFANWVIPRDAANADLAWELIETVTDETASQGILEQLGETPANKAAQAAITDPVDKFLADLVADPSVVNIDQVMDHDLALFMYKQFELAYAGKQDAAETMEKVQTFAESQGG